MKELVMTKKKKNKYVEFAIHWNNKHPLDRWWRKKHGVAFGSSEHLLISFVHQRLEYEEDRLFQKLENEQNKSNEEFSETEVVELGKVGGKRTIKMTQKEIDEEFDKIDLAEYNN